MSNINRFNLRGWVHGDIEDGQINAPPREEQSFKIWTDNIALIDGKFHRYSPMSSEWVRFAKDEIGMMSIGLCDKNGKEIFEGDIVERLNFSDLSNKFVIEWEVHMCEGMMKWVGFEIPTTDDLIILGNIYENPELFKKENP